VPGGPFNEICSDGYAVPFRIAPNPFRHITAAGARTELDVMLGIYCKLKFHFFQRNYKAILLIISSYRLKTIGRHPGASRDLSAR